jgi:hypothetical protein
MNHDIVVQVLREYETMRRPDPDPELQTVRVAILLEDVFDIALSDAEIDPAVLADYSAVAALVARLQGAV